MKTRVALTAGLALVLIGILALISCEKSKAPEQAKQAGGTAPAQTEERVEKNPDRNAYFGEEHIHTSWSVDAWLMGNRLTGPDDALKYAQGQTIKHPLGYDIKIDTPMDFMGVTDHSEYVGITRSQYSGFGRQQDAPGAASHSEGPERPGRDPEGLHVPRGLNSGPPVKAFMSPEVAGSIWKKNVKIADANNHPGKFTAFCSYEWTSMPNYRNLHRNIFFKDCAKVPEMPFSALDSNHPEDLWKWMDAQRKAGNELLAISHNANLSDGWMYPVDLDSYGRPIDAAWAASRDRNERLVEIKQIKGQSETHPLLSPNDEFASYEIFQDGLLGQPATGGRIDHIQGSFARQASKTASPCRTCAATTHTSSAWPAAPTRTTPAVLTARTISTAVTPRLTEPLTGALPESSRSAPSTFAWKTPAASPGFGPRKILALRSGTPCIARKPSASAARISRFASSAAGATTKTS